MKLSGSLSLKIIRGVTGREGYHSISDRPTAHAEVQEFVLRICQAEKLDWIQLLEHDAVASHVYLNSLNAVRRGILGKYFRSRPFSATGTYARSCDFGPPPLGRQGRGRYNEHGHRVHYLSRTQETAALECRATQETPRIVLQEFALNLPDAKIILLDMDLEENHPYLHYLLLDSEYPLTETSELPNLRNPYRATHFLAFVCSRIGISGIEYPSIRGNFKENAEAVNLALFEEAIDRACSVTVGEPVEWKNNP